MLGKPKVTVLMPAYNAERYIKVAIDSILNQTYKNLSLFVWDDCSNDKTKDIISTFKDPRIKVFSSNINLGYKRVWNELIFNSSSDYLAFQDADDWSDKYRLENQMEELSENPEIAVCGTWAYITNQQGEIIKLNDRPKGYKEIMDYARNHNPILGASMMVKREVLLETGGYRNFFIENNLSFQDFDVALRILERYKGINLPEPLYYYRQHPASNSKQISVMRNISERIVLFLAGQRRKHGFDGLQDPRFFDELMAHIEELKRPYLQDPSRIYRDYAAHFMFARLHGAAIGASARAVASGPARLVNYRTLLYCIRKSLF